MLRSICRKIRKVFFFWGIFRSRPSLVAPLPTHIEVEPTTRCNATCGTCSRNYLAQENMKTDISLQAFSEILDAIPTLKSIRLLGLGEVFLHPQIDELLAELKKRSIKVWIITNGSMLQDEKIRNLIHDHVYDLGISVDSTDEAEFARLRPMGKIGLADVIDGARQLIEERKNGRSDVIIGLCGTITHENAHDLPSLGSLCIDLAVDYLSMGFIENWLMKGDVGHQETSDRIHAEMNHLPAIHKLLKRQRWLLALNGIVMGFKIPRRRLGKCHWPYRSVHITAEGNVTPCCTRTQPNHGLFNMSEGSFATNWNGAAYQDLRRAHMNKDYLNRICGDCPI